MIDNIFKIDIKTRLALYKLVKFTSDRNFMYLLLIENNNFPKIK